MTIHLEGRHPTLKTLLGMKINAKICIVTALVAASSMSKTAGLRVPRIRSSHLVMSTSTASLLNIPEPITANGYEEHGDHEIYGIDKANKKPRNQNPAIGDTAFLRKRTAHLLRITSENYPSGVGSNDQLSRNMKVDRKTFHWLIDSWAFSGELDASDKAQALLSRMEDLYSSCSNTNIRPDVRSYTKVINAISRSGNADAGDVAEKIFSKMESLHLSGKNVAAKPNTLTYTALIEAHANSAAPGSATRAAELCDIMVQKWDDGDPDVKPTSRCFNAAINAYAKSGEQDVAQQAESLFESMIDIYEAGNDECKPNAFNYNAVIAALANSREDGCAQRAEEFLRRMEAQCRAGDQDVKPTTVSFNTVIDAYAKSGADDAAERAENLLRHMDELNESGENIDAKPNVRSFNTVINAYAKSGRADAAMKAERVLDLMEKLYEAGNEDVRPDVHSFSTVINAWARSHRHGKAERAQNLFREMRKLFQAGNEHLRPNVVAYNAVMNACAFTKGDVHESNRAVEIAHAVLRDLEQSTFGNPDQVTYGTFLKVCATQMADCDSRDKVVDMLFKKCCKDGQVGTMVLQQLKCVAKNDHFVRLTGRAIWEDLKFEELPSDWWRNVIEGKGPRRRRRYDQQAGNRLK